MLNKKCIMFYFVIYWLCLLKVEKRVTLTIRELKVFEMLEYGQKCLPCALFLWICWVYVRCIDKIPYSIYTDTQFRTSDHVLSEYKRCMDTVCSVQRAISKANSISIRRIMFNVIFCFLIQYLCEHCDHTYSSVERSPWILVFHFMQALENVFNVSSLAHLLSCSNIFGVCLSTYICNLLVLWPFTYSRLW